MVLIIHKKLERLPNSLSEKLRFQLSFFSSSRPVNTFNYQKCTFWVLSESTSKLFSENYFHFLGSEYPNLVENLNLFNFSYFLSNLEFEFRNIKLSKIEFSESEYLNLVANVHSFWIFLFFYRLDFKFWNFKGSFWKQLSKRTKIQVFWFWKFNFWQFEISKFEL